MVPLQMLGPVLRRAARSPGGGDRPIPRPPSGVRDCQPGPMRRLCPGSTPAMASTTRAIIASAAACADWLADASLWNRRMARAMASTPSATRSGRGAGSIRPSAATGDTTQGMPAAKLSRTLPLIPAPNRRGATVSRTREKTSAKSSTGPTTSIRSSVGGRRPAAQPCPTIRHEMARSCAGSGRATRRSRHGRLTSASAATAPSRSPGRRSSPRTGRSAAPNIAGFASLVAFGTRYAPLRSGTELAALQSRRETFSAVSIEDRWRSPDTTGRHRSDDRTRVRTRGSSRRSSCVTIQVSRRASASSGRRAAGGDRRDRSDAGRPRCPRPHAPGGSPRQPSDLSRDRWRRCV
jgi:hypothetical protein